MNFDPVVVKDNCSTMAYVNQEELAKTVPQTLKPFFCLKTLQSP